MGDHTVRPRPKAIRDRVIVALARLLNRAFFRSVEVEGPPPPDGPVVLAASHLYGFVDPVLLVAHLGAMPRFLAKGTLWKVPVARWLLNFARVIPVHRRDDGATAADNVGMFASAVEALRSGGMVALFPEGTTHDEPTLRPLRTGAARICIDAATAGVQGVALVPVGVSYEDKVRVRGRALVSYGEPIPVAAPAPGEDPHAAARALTDRLGTELNALTPHFETTEEALALDTAAAMSLSDDGSPPPLRDIAGRSRRLARLAPDRRAALVDLVARYRMLLGFVGLGDADIMQRGRLADTVRRLVVLVVLGILLAPLAVAGLYANLVPALLVLVAGLAVRAPVSKGTIRLLVAFVAFPVTWVVWAWQDSTAGPLGDLARAVTYPIDLVVGPDPEDRTGTLANVLAFVVTPLLGVASLLLIERGWALATAVVRSRTLLDRRGQLDEVRERRAQVVSATMAALADPASKPRPSLRDSENRGHDSVPDRVDASAAAGATESTPVRSEHPAVDPTAAPSAARTAAPAQGRAEDPGARADRP